MVVPHRLKRIRGFRRGVFGMRVVDVNTTAIGRDHIGDVELRGVGKQIGMGRGAAQPSAASIVNGILLPVIPTDMAALLISGGADHIE